MIIQKTIPQIKNEKIQDLLIVISKQYPWISISYEFSYDYDTIHYSQTLIRHFVRETHSFLFKNVSPSDFDDILLIHDVLKLRPNFFYNKEKELSIEYIF
jgi:hypothetical protein